MAQSILASLPHELANIILFFRCLLTVGLCAGLIAIPLALIGNAWSRLGRVIKTAVSRG